MYQRIKEGKAELYIPKETKISKKLPVFYNPVMEFNRDMSIALLNSVLDKGIVIGDILAGSGVRSIRFLKELAKGKVKSLFINDYSREAVKMIEKNLKLNQIKYKKISLSELSKIPKKGAKRGISLLNEDANLMMLHSKGFDYIDLDPFGSPNQFIGNSIQRLARCGILAVTATDTSALCGTFVNACKRKYWAVPQKGPNMHEIGLRILIRKVQLVGAQFEKALTPIYSYSKDHYMRIFFRCSKGKKKVDNVLKQHSMLGSAGPVYAGELWDTKLAKKIHEAIQDKFTKTIMEESKIKTTGFYAVSKIAKKYKIGDIPKKEFLIKKIKDLGYKASSTHFDLEGIRSNISEKEFVKILKKK